jgi:ABC-type polysaccharide/polyol phosphate export permease
MFNQSTSFAMNSMVWGSKLLQQIYLPNTSFVVSTILANMVNFVLSLIPLFAIMLITGVPVRWTVVFVPFAMLLIGTFSLGFGLLMSTLAVFFPDVAEIYPVILRAWMYMTPIIVPVEILEGVLNGWVLRLNPLYYIVDIFRQVIYHGVVPSPRQWLVAVIVSFGTLVIGWVFFCNKADRFAYYV